MCGNQITWHKFCNHTKRVKISLFKHYISTKSNQLTRSGSIQYYLFSNKFIIMGALRIVNTVHSTQNTYAEILKHKQFFLKLKKGKQRTNK